MAILSGHPKELSRKQLSTDTKQRLLEIVKLLPPDEAVFLASVQLAIQKASSTHSTERSEIKN